MSEEPTWSAVRDPAVAQVLTRHYGFGTCPAWSLNRESVNQVWYVETPGGPGALKRLGRDVTPEWLAFERAALPRLTAAGIPVAAPLLTVEGATSARTGGSVWQLRPWREGRPFDSARPQDLERAGAFLSALHRIPVDGLPAGGHSATQNLEFWLTTERPLQAALDEVDEIAAPHVTPAVRKHAQRAYSAVLHRARAELDGYQDLPAVLTHGEVAGSNLLYSASGALTCVLDWDALQLRSRVYDVARAVLFLPRRARGSFQVLPERARAVLTASTAHEPLGPGELRALLPVLELNFVPSPGYLRQVARHAPGILDWYLGWRAEGATTVRGVLSEVVAAVPDRTGR
ncbi:phosphotransferase enzyme family protein [Streptomyces iconiensis]|uniref:Phosphotransferase n=1 Tax=Streptomyces iconiensis TaxID=1384038 RepID=A0ABT6ZNY7_9ACTN|nr:phosphotransferase [Streptomyces iconiensis]MDJ1130763.1 phosphotransferase [Streptomyces iconiensis]